MKCYVYYAARGVTLLELFGLYSDLTLLPRSEWCVVNLICVKFLDSETDLDVLVRVHDTVLSSSKSAIESSNISDISKTEILTGSKKFFSPFISLIIVSLLE